MDSLAPSKPARRTSRVLEHTLHGIAETLERALFAEEISARPGLFQSLDPRAKIVAVLALLIAANLSHSLAVIAAIYLLALGLAWRSAIPAGFFIKRVWLALPFFTGLIVLPALFITPGPVLVQLLPGLAITRTGVTTVLFLLLRVSTSVSLTLLLILTTRWNVVLSALGVLEGAGRVYPDPGDDPPLHLPADPHRQRHVPLAPQPGGGAHEPGRRAQAAGGAERQPAGQVAGSEQRGLPGDAVARFPRHNRDAETFPHAAPRLGLAEHFFGLGRPGLYLGGEMKKVNAMARGESPQPPMAESVAELLQPIPPLPFPKRKGGEK